MTLGKDTLISDVADAYRTALGTDEGIKAGELADKIASITSTVNTKGAFFENIGADGKPRKLIIDGMSAVGRYAFSADDNAVYEKVEEIELRSTVTQLGASCFYGMENLANIDALFKNVDTFGSKCFGNCTGLTEVFLDMAVISAIPSIFSGCTNLEVIRVPWSENAVLGAPWGAANAEIVYNWRGDEEA